MALDFTGMKGLERPYVRRLEDAKKLLLILDSEADADLMDERDMKFYKDVRSRADAGNYPVGEGQLAWLRHLVEKYT